VTRTPLDPALLAELASVDTPTISNAWRKVHEHERALREYVMSRGFSLEGLRERVLGRAAH
jgi:hypothetical protein